MELTVKQEEIVHGLRALGLKKGYVVLAHSSLASFGRVEGGANTVIDSLLEVVGREGTIMVPTLTGSEKLSAENPPIFDVCNSPCWTGKIPETFRKRKESVRSLHPTHSVASIGSLAEYLTRGHEECVTPCGAGSPYHKLTQLCGSVLLLGVGLHSCTLFHTVEELMKVPYVLQDEPVLAKIIDTQGNEIMAKIRIHQYGNLRNFSKMEPILLREGAMRTGLLARSRVCLIDAEKLLKITLKRLKSDPYFMLEFSKS